MSWAAAEEKFAAALHNYESRPEQQRLATQIEDTLAAGEIIAAQAGTGTGKSLALLVPLIDHARKTGLPAVVATATKALQDQYAGKDLPFLQQSLETPFTWAVLKGRSNYICRAKLKDLKPGDVVNAGSLMEELERPEHSGDWDDLVSDIDARDKPKLTSSSDECPGKFDCPFGKVCFAEAAKAKAKESDIVVVNHALLVTDLWVRSQFTDAEGNPVGMLPEYGAVGIDEAHELEEYATSILGQSFTQRGMLKLATEIINFTNKPELSQKINGSAGILFEHLGKLLAADSTSRDRTTRLTNQDILSLERPVTLLLDALRNAWAEVNEVDVRGDDGLVGRKKRIKKRISSLGQRLTDVLVAESSQLVRWIEKEERVIRGNRETSISLQYAPLHVGPFLRDNLWANVPGALLSATLSFDGDFSYITGRLGIDRYRSFDAGTPFDYPKQAALFIPQDMDPSPNSRARWAAMCGVTMQKLVLAAGGRSLLLFTSRKAMNEAYAAVVPALQGQGLQVLRQGDQPNRVLAETFKNDETSVLFALKSFMTGVDVQGDALRLVIIDKLPFPVPTDVIFAARCDEVESRATRYSEKAFPSMTVPAMALTLLQAFGRLIRTKQDQGMVAILDSRLHTKGYGRQMKKALPPAKPIETLAEATEYLRALDE